MVDEIVKEKEEEDRGVYDDEKREELLEGDEISSGEAAFMEGYEDTETVLCENCETRIPLENHFEKEFDKKKHKFCSNNCALEWQENQRE